MPAAFRMSDAETLIQLAAGLNAGYFTFKGTNLPFFTRSEDIFKEIKEAARQLNGKNQVHYTNLVKVIEKYDKFMQEIYRPDNGCDHLFYVCGFLIFFLCTIYIGVSSLYINLLMPYCLAVSFFILSYAPIIAAILTETKSRFRYNEIRKAAIKARDEALPTLASLPPD